MISWPLCGVWGDPVTGETVWVFSPQKGTYTGITRCPVVWWTSEYR